MKKGIVEKKFASCCPSNSNQPRQFRQVQTPTNVLEEVSSIYQNVEQHHTLYSQFKDKSHSYQNNHNSTQFYKKESASELLSYSQTQVNQFEEQAFPLMNKLVRLFISREHIQNHIANSLGVKGYRGQNARQIAKIVTNSFGQYINLAQKIVVKLKEKKEYPIDERTMMQNRIIAKLKMENARQFQEMTRLEEQNHTHKKRIVQISSHRVPPMSKDLPKSSIEQAKQAVKAQKINMISKMEKLETQVYQKLTKYQETLLELSAFRNHLMLDKINSNYTRLISTDSNGCQTEAVNYSQSEPQSESEDYRQQLIDAYNNIIEEKDTQINRLSELIVQTTDELDLQKKLYDEMLEKNLTLEKEVYFLNAQNQSVQQTSSFHIQEEPGSIPRALRSPSFQDPFE